MTWPPLPGGARTVALAAAITLLGTGGVLGVTLTRDTRSGADRTPAARPSDTRPVTRPPGASPSGSGSSGTGAPSAGSAADPQAPIGRVGCPAVTVPVHDSAGLRQALAGARPGAVIGLADGTYAGMFEASADAPADRPIWLCGGRGAVLDGGSVSGGYVLHLQDASGWRVLGLTVRNGQKGVMLDHVSGTLLQDLLVERVGDEAVHLRRASTGNVVRGLTVRGTGLRKQKFGEGLYVGTAKSNWCEVSGCQPDRSDRNHLLDNTIADTTAEAIDIKEGTSAGVLAGNRFDGAGTAAADSWVDVKGNGWLIVDNVGSRAPHDGFQTHEVVTGWGDGNVFTGNTADLAGSGTAFNLTVPGRNRLGCDNTVRGGARLSNVRCQG